MNLENFLASIFIFHKYLTCIFNFRIQELITEGREFVEMNVLTDNLVKQVGAKVIQRIKQIWRNYQFRLIAAEENNLEKENIKIIIKQTLAEYINDHPLDYEQVDTE